MISQISVLTLLTITIAYSLDISVDAKEKMDHAKRVCRNCVAASDSDIVPGLVFNESGDVPGQFYFDGQLGLIDSTATDDTTVIQTSTPTMLTEHPTDTTAQVSPEDTTVQDPTDTTLTQEPGETTTAEPEETTTTPEPEETTPEPEDTTTPEPEEETTTPEPEETTTTPEPEETTPEPEDTTTPEPEEETTTPESEETTTPEETTKDPIDSTHDHTDVISTQGPTDTIKPQSTSETSTQESGQTDGITPPSSTTHIETTTLETSGTPEEASTVSSEPSPIEVETEEDMGPEWSGDCAYAEDYTSFVGCSLLPDGNASEHLGVWSSCGKPSCTIGYTVPAMPQRDDGFLKTFLPKSVSVRSYVSGTARIDVSVKLGTSIAPIGSIDESDWEEIFFNLPEITEGAIILFEPSSTRYPYHVDIIDKMSVRFSTVIFPTVTTNPTEETTFSTEYSDSTSRTSLGTTSPSPGEDGASNVDLVFIILMSLLGVITLGILGLALKVYLSKRRNFRERLDSVISSYSNRDFVMSDPGYFNEPPFGSATDVRNPQNTFTVNGLEDDQSPHQLIPRLTKKI